MSKFLSIPRLLLTLILLYIFTHICVIFYLLFLWSERIEYITQSA